MNRKKILNIFLAVLLLACWSKLANYTFAQTADLTVAQVVDIEGGNVRKGAIVVNDGKVVKNSLVTYEETLFGVIVENPSISIGRKDDNQGIPVATTGTVQVLVNSENGRVKTGDYITSSSTEGVGMRARIPGRVLGIALEDVPENEETFLLSAVIKVEYVTAQALFNNSSLDGNIADYEGNPFGISSDQTRISTYIRYGSSGLLAISSFVFSIIYYTQLSKKEVDAIGRNPLAASLLRKDMRKHGFIAIIIALSGFILSVILFNM